MDVSIVLGIQVDLSIDSRVLVACPIVFNLQVDLSMVDLFKTIERSTWTSKTMERVGKKVMYNVILTPMPIKITGLTMKYPSSFFFMLLHADKCNFHIAPSKFIWRYKREFSVFACQKTSLLFYKSHTSSH